MDTWQVNAIARKKKKIPNASIVGLQFPDKS